MSRQILLPLTGGAFGLEGGLVATVTTLLGMATLLLLRLQTSAPQGTRASERAA